MAAPCGAAIFLSAKTERIIWIIQRKIVTLQTEIYYNLKQQINEATKSFITDSTTAATLCDGNRKHTCGGADQRRDCELSATGKASADIQWHTTDDYDRNCADEL